jgi:hypothetical protein
LDRSIPHGREHSIQWLARELNIDRLSLAGGLLGGRASEVEAKRKFTVAEAFETRRARSEREESRNRKVKAEAETAEDPQRLKFRSIYRILFSPLRLSAPLCRRPFLPCHGPANPDSTSKLCRVDERVAKGTFPRLGLEPFDSLLDLRGWQRCRDRNPVGSGILPGEGAECLPSSWPVPERAQD